MVVNITIGITVMLILNIPAIVIIAKLTVGELKERMEASFPSKQLA